MSENALAGAASPEPDRNEGEVREIFPVRLDRDFKDFRPEVEDATQGDPKDSFAPVSVDELRSVTGLEDVSQEELASPAQTNVEKDSTKVSQPENGRLTSYGETSPGKNAQPAKT